MTDEQVRNHPLYRELLLKTEELARRNVQLRLENNGIKKELHRRPHHPLPAIFVLPPEGIGRCH